MQLIGEGVGYSAKECAAIPEGPYELLHHLYTLWGTLTTPSGNPDNRRSTTGFIFMFGGAPISFSSLAQTLKAQLATKAELTAASYDVKESAYTSLTTKGVVVQQAAREFPTKV